MAAQLVTWLFLAAVGSDVPIRTVEAEPDQGTDRVRVNLRVAAGAEWDTNARRAVPNDGGDVLSSASRPTEVVSDGLARVTVDTKLRLDLAPGHRIVGAYLLGAKRFFRESGEDLLVNSASLSTAHGLTSWLTVTTVGAAKLSRIRNGSRNYNFGFGQGSLILHPVRTFDVDLHGGLTVFTFPVESNFDYLGPRAGGALRYRPMRGLSLSAGFDWVWRRYEGNALVIGTVPDENQNPINVLTFCTPEDREEGVTCAAQGRRRDTEAQISANVAYRGTFVLGGGYLLRMQRSNSDLEDIDRHRLSVFATIGLPLDLTLNVLAALQINNGVSLTDTKFLAEDDETQNSVQVGLGYALTEEIGIDLRYALFANQFSTNDVDFLRQTVYLGVAYRVGQ